MPPSDSVTRTIRIDTEVDDFLRRFSDKEGVSVNFLVNRSLRKLVEWDVYAEKFGIVALPSSLIAKMMDCLEDGEAKELGAWVGKHLLKEFLTFWFKEVSMQSLVRGYPRLAAQYGKTFEYEEHVEAGQWVIVLKHAQGDKWSLYYEELLRAAFSDLLKTEITTEKTENQVVARFSVR